NEIVALFGLYVDVGERLVDPLAHGNEAVVDRDDPQHEDDDHADDDPGDGGGGHEGLLGRLSRAPIYGAPAAKGSGARACGTPERTNRCLERSRASRRDEAIMAVSIPVTADAQSGAAIVATDIPARLDRLRWGRFHTLVVVALGITWILDGLEVTLAGLISPALKE